MCIRENHEVIKSYEAPSFNILTSIWVLVKRVNDVSSIASSVMDPFPSTKTS